MTLLKLAHEGQVILASRAISQHYAKGNGVAKDMAEALHWLKLGADEGDPWAEADLGRMYWEGDNAYRIKQDWEEALFHFTRAVNLFEEHGYNESDEIKEPMLSRASLAHLLPMELVAEIWDRAQASVEPKTAEPNRGAAAH